MNIRLPLIFGPTLLFLVTTIIIILGIIYGWFGVEKEGLMLFCEHARSGYIKQPSNSFSNLGFSFAGLYVAWFAYKDRFYAKNLMSTLWLYPQVISASLIILGAGSFVMHATNTYWSGFFDLFGMFLFSSFIFCYALRRWFHFSETSFLILYVVNVAICSYVFLTPSLNELGILLKGSEVCFAAQLLLGILLEIVLKYGRKMDINVAWGWASVFTLILSFTIWNLSRTPDSFWCNPHSLLQGHALWHLLDALAIYFTFQYYVSEGAVAIE